MLFEQWNQRLAFWVTFNTDYATRNHHLRVFKIFKKGHVLNRSFECNKKRWRKNKIEIILPKIRPLCYGMMRYKPPPPPLFAHSLRYKRFACRASIGLKPILWPITFWYWKIGYMNRFYLLYSCPLVLDVALCLPPFNPPSPPSSICKYSVNVYSNLLVLRRKQVVVQELPVTRRAL